MHKSILKRYLMITMSIVLASYVVLGCLTMFLYSNFWQKEKDDLLTKNASAVATFAATYVEYDDTTGSATMVINNQGLTVILDLISNSVDADIFITDLSGNRLIGTSTNIAGSVDKLVLVSEEVVEIAADGYYSDKGNMGGIYANECYTVVIPLSYADAITGETVVIGAVFASTNVSSIKEYTISTLQMYVMAAVITLLLTFVVVCLYSYRMTKPLTRMSQAAKAFGEGDFSVRVPVESSDEIGQLSLALNNMANSLSNSEGMRRSFVANVSHELKTPMTTIGGFIDGILDGTIPKEKEKQYLKIVSDEVKRLARLVKSMLDLSRIDSGEMKINPVKFDISATVFTTILTFEQKIEEKNLDIRGLEDVGPLTIHGDQDLIHQIIYNLIENAVKFTDDSGYIKFVLSDSYDRVCVSIENSGKGIEPDDLPMIFDKFYKSDKSRSQDKNGMGLGLYLVKTIIKLHGGDITVQSALNSFSRFEFFLPKKEELKPKATSGGVINLSDTADLDIQEIE